MPRALAMATLPLLLNCLWLELVFLVLAVLLLAARLFQTMLNKTRAPCLLLRVCHMLLMSTALSKS
jgi:hypothetical protein